MTTDREAQEAMVLTAGIITMIDDAVGEIIKEQWSIRNPVIGFNSEHGGYLSNFNMLMNGPWALRSVKRVPMIWSEQSSRTGRVTAALASTIDQRIDCNK
ncbi:MAG: hypothetical protein ACI9UN_000349 [Granulosicoccus sp.]|jgi:hypothetical protein